MNAKQIEFSLPKGFVFGVEETKALGIEGVFVLKNQIGKRLYVRLCEEKDLLKGLIFEILSPKELRNLGIKVEETAHTELDKPFYVEETMNEGAEDDQQMKEALERAKKKMAQNRVDDSKVVINITPKDEEKGKEPQKTEDLTEASKLLEQLKTKISDEMQDTFGIMVEPRSLEDCRNFKKILDEHKLKIAEKSDSDVKIPSGTTPLYPQGSTSRNEEGFDSVESMIDTLRTIQKFGESAEERKEAKLILDELMRKTIEGMRKEKPRTIHYEDSSTETYAERENRRLGLRKKKESE